MGYNVLLKTSWSTIWRPLLAMELTSASSENSGWCHWCKAWKLQFHRVPHKRIAMLFRSSTNYSGYKYNLFCGWSLQETRGAGTELWRPHLWWALPWSVDCKGCVLAVLVMDLTLKHSLLFWRVTLPTQFPFLLFQDLQSRTAWGACLWSCTQSSTWAAPAGTSFLLYL